MSGVRLEGLVKASGALQGVHGIDVEVAEKEFVVVVGPSGCGKSTTLPMVAALEEISGGDLTIDGRHMNRVAPTDCDGAMVVQNHALYPHLDEAEDIAFGLRIRKESMERIASSVDEVAGILGPTPCLDRKPSDLSGGQRQRVAMGRAIARRPKAFLFDEPPSNLDARLRTQIRTEIKPLRKRLGVTSTSYPASNSTFSRLMSPRLRVTCMVLCSVRSDDWRTGHTVEHRSQIHGDRRLAANTVALA
jgi:multiple sugar transport system ATP-binding protein